MRVIDAFLWSGSAREDDVLKLRVRTLAKHVEVQVPVSATLTHQGEPPPGDGLPPIAWDPEDVPARLLRHYLAAVTPIPDGGRGGMDTPYRFWIEAQHRDACVAAADAAGAGPDDIVMVSDVDEIPDPATLDRIVEAVELHGEVSVPMRMHGFALEYLYPTAWRGTTASRRRDMAPQDQRNRRGVLPAAGSGWHLSWLGTDADRLAKLDSFSHAELRGRLDVVANYRQGVHANGERLRRLSVDEMIRLRWPEPMVNGSWTPPRSWYAPSGDDTTIVYRQSDVDLRLHDGGG